MARLVKECGRAFAMACQGIFNVQVQHAQGHWCAWRDIRIKIAFAGFPGPSDGIVGGDSCGCSSAIIVWVTIIMSNDSFY